MIKRNQEIYEWEEQTGTNTDFAEAEEDIEEHSELEGL